MWCVFLRATLCQALYSRIKAAEAQLASNTDPAMYPVLVQNLVDLSKEFADNLALLATECRRRDDAKATSLRQQEAARKLSNLKKLRAEVLVAFSTLAALHTTLAQLQARHREAGGLGDVVSAALEKAQNAVVSAATLKNLLPSALTGAVDASGALSSKPMGAAEDVGGLEDPSIEAIAMQFLQCVCLCGVASPAKLRLTSVLLRLSVCSSVPIASTAVSDARAAVDDRERQLKQQQTMQEAYAVKVQHAHDVLKRAKGALKTAQLENR